MDPLEPAMTMPPAPSPAPDPLTPSRLSRRCSACTSPLDALGTRALRTTGPAGEEGVLLLEMFWCPHCGKVEFYSVR